MRAITEVRDELNSLVPLIRENPFLTVGILLGTVAAVVLLGLAVKHVRQYEGGNFIRIIDDVEEVAVLTHSNPDPDAMACAMAVKELAESRGTDVTLYYPGQIRHHENRAFTTVLDIDMENIESIADVQEENVILVDHNEARGFDGAKSIDPIAVLDHHPFNDPGAEYEDIRPEVGSCSTILAEYFEQFGWEPDQTATTDEKGKLSPNTATGLLYGIQSDTDHLTNGCTDKDFDAVQYLHPGVDQDKLDRISNPEVDSECLKVKARAINNHETRSAFAVSDVGEVSNLDAIPQAADELRRLEGLNAVVVMGEKDGEIHFSARSNDDRVHIGRVVEKAVEDIPLADAGGHARMAGGRFEIEHMEEYGPDDTCMTREEFKEKLFVEMNGGE